MPSTITGPGIDTAGGASSSIGAVSVSIVADTGPLTAGLARAHGDVQTFGTQAARTAAADGRVTGEKAAGGIVEGLNNEAKGLKRAVQAIHRIFSVAGAATLIHGAYQLGRSIGESMFGGTDPFLKNLEERVAQTGKVFDEQRRKLHAESADAMRAASRPVVNVDAFADAAARSEELDEKLLKNADTLNNLYEIWNHVHELQKRGKLLPEELDAQAARLEQIRRLEADRTKLAIERQKAVEGGLRATREETAAIKQQNEALVTQLSERDRISAQRDVAAEKMAVDISRLRQLMELGVRQRVPAAPGNHVLRGERH